MKEIRVKHIPGIEDMPEKDIFELMTSQTECNPLDCVNWQEYPYAPAVSFHLAHSEKALAVLFKVTEDHLRGTALENNGPVWEDSCVETFIADPFSNEYFNFETNCIGTKLASKRRSRTDADHFSDGLMDRIRCFGSLPHEPVDSEGEGQSWWLAEIIPFELIGLEKAPESLRANFYKCGDRCSRMHFLSWSEIDLPAPDFHCPDFFGKLILEH